MKAWLFAAMFAGLMAGCGEKTPQVLGTAFQGTAIPIALARQTNMPAEIVLQGTMTEKCPVAGCWFILQDNTGTIKVDTKNAGFVVVDVPLRRAMTVAGHVTTNGTERVVEATGVRF